MSMILTSPRFCSLLAARRRRPKSAALMMQLSHDILLVLMWCWRVEDGVELEYEGRHSAPRARLFIRDNLELTSFQWSHPPKLPMDSERHAYGPPLKTFHYTELSSHVTTKGKPPASRTDNTPPRTKSTQKPVDLKKCHLYELTQYRCLAPDKVNKGEPVNQITCTPFLRFFRKLV